MGPDPDEERVYLVQEIERVSQEIGRLQSQGWLKKVLARTAGPSIASYEHYLHQLDTYERVINRFENKIADGRIPFRVIITNIDAKKHTAISTKVRVHNGEFLLTEQLPVRPDRPDSPYEQVDPNEPQPATDWPTSAFIRSKTAIHPHHLAAEFSVLEPGEDAALLNQTLVIVLEPETRVSYEVRSAQGNPERGDAEL